jgi:hypothetical protein
MQGRFVGGRFVGVPFFPVLSISKMFTMLLHMQYSICKYEHIKDTTGIVVRIAK